MMRLKISKRLFLFCILGLLLSFPSVSGGKEADYDLANMIRMNPDFSTYPDASGIVWLHRVAHNEIAPDKTERKVLWVILGRKGISERWLRWNIPNPCGGTAEVTEAAVYEFPSGRKAAELRPESVLQGDVPMNVVSFDSLPEQFILVISWKESLENVTDGLVWLQDELPIWESVVSASVFSINSFFYTADMDNRPQLQKTGDKTVYNWRFINRKGLQFPSLRVQDREALCFSSLRGEDKFKSLLMKNDPLSAAAYPAMPSRIEAKGKDLKSGAAFVLTWLFEQPELVLPEGASRSMPSQGPWTRVEKILLARAWLGRLGVNTRLYWSLPYDPDTDAPVSAGVLTSPILEVLPGGKAPAKGKTGFFYDLSSKPQPEKTSPLLGGRTVYGLSSEGTLTSIKIPESKAAENRLTVNFDLKLTSDGFIGGEMRVKAKNAWQDFLFCGKKDELALKALLEKSFPRSTRIKNIALKEGKQDSELSMTLDNTSGIMSAAGESMLASMPPFIPSWLSELMNSSGAIKMAFPFMIDVKVNVSLPNNTEKVFLPSDVAKTPGDIGYFDSYKLIKNRKLTAEAQCRVLKSFISDDNLMDLKRAVAQLQTFMTRPLPLKLK